MYSEASIARNQVVFTRASEVMPMVSNCSQIVFSKERASRGQALWILSCPVTRLLLGSILK